MALSRRGFTAAIASLPLLSSALRAGEAAPLPAATDAAKHLTVTVEVNGRPFRFVVDTGAERTVLADTTVAALGLAASGTVMLAGIVRTVPAEMVEVASVSVGPVARENLRLPILPRSELLADGYLGLDMIDGSRVVLDFQNGALEISDPLPYLATVYAPKHVTVIPARGDNGHLRAAQCTVERRHVMAFIDTGAESTMGNEALYRQLTESNPSYVSHKTTDLIGLTGGTATGRLITPHLAEIGTLSFIDGTIAIADLQVFDMWGLKDEPTLLIGMNWLRQFKRVSIDYGRRQIRFEMSQTRFGPIPLS
jgi:predicted aspartyl protease